MSPFNNHWTPQEIPADSNHQGLSTSRQTTSYNTTTSGLDATIQQSLDSTGDTSRQQPSGTVHVQANDSGLDATIQQSLDSRGDTSRQQPPGTVHVQANNILQLHDKRFGCHHSTITRLHRRYQQTATIRDCPRPYNTTTSGLDATIQQSLDSRGDTSRQQPPGTVHVQANNILQHHDKRFGCHHSTITRLQRRYQQTATTRDCPRPGKQHLTTPRQAVWMPPFNNH